MLKKFLNWNWVKNSFEGNNNTASSRRLTTFWFVVLVTLNTVGMIAMAYIVVLTKDISAGKSIEAMSKLIELQIILCSMVLLLAAIVSVTDLNNVVRSVKGLPATPVEVKTTTETTSVVTPQ